MKKLIELDYTMKLILPTSIILPRKKKKPRRVALSKNQERNMHYIIYSQVKKAFVEEVKKAIPEGFKLEAPIHMHFTYFHGSRHLADLDNAVSVIRKFLQDSLIELGYLESDDWRFIPSSSESFGGIDPKNGRCEVTITTIDK